MGGKQDFQERTDSCGESRNQIYVQESVNPRKYSCIDVIQESQETQNRIFFDCKHVNFHHSLITIQEIQKRH